METLWHGLITGGVVFVFFAVGYNAANSFFRRQAKDQKAKQICLTKIDFWSYLMTTIPLIGLLTMFVFRDNGYLIAEYDRDYITTVLTIIAAVGAGAGIARRKLSLQLVRD